MANPWIGMAKEDKKNNCYHHHGCWGGGYFLGFIGAATYFMSQTDGFWLGVLALLKAMVWPAFIVYYLLKFLIGA